MKAGLAD